LRGGELGSKGVLAGSGWATYSPAVSFSIKSTV